MIMWEEVDKTKLQLRERIAQVDGGGGLPEGMSLELFITIPMGAVIVESEDANGDKRKFQLTVHAMLDALIDQHLADKG